MKDIISFLPIILFATIGIWIASDELFENRMGLLNTDKKRKKYERFLHNFSLNLKENDGFGVAIFVSFLSAIIFLVLLILINSGIEWILNFHFPRPYIGYILIFIPFLFLVFYLRTVKSRNIYIDKINTTVRQKLKKVDNELFHYRIKIEKKIEQFESEISKTDRAIQEVSINQNAKNELEKEITELQLQIIKYKKVSNEIKELSSRISVHFKWEEWLFKKVEEKLNPEQKEKFENYYDLANIYHPNFIDTVIDYYYKISHIIDKIKYQDLKRELIDNKDFVEFNSKNNYGIIEQDFKNVISQCKSIL